MPTATSGLGVDLPRHPERNALYRLLEEYFEQYARTHVDFDAWKIRGNDRDFGFRLPAEWAQRILAAGGLEAMLRRSKAAERSLWERALEAGAVVAVHDGTSVHQAHADRIVAWVLEQGR